MSRKLLFPANFYWGTATSSYQIEGAWDADGRGESIWDRFAHTPGAVRNNENGDVACDHYHRWREDIALIRSLGTNAYRFSIAWPRIQPTGRGAPNARGLDFYSRLVDALLEAGIQPFVTLYHWDLPQALQDAGGWPRRATAEAFAEYADIVTRHLGDRVAHWLTLNEPWCASILSYQIGEHAPGLKDWRLALAAAHHLLLAHGLAAPLIRRNSPQAEVGIVLNLTPAEPASPSPADYQAARSFDGYFNRWFLDPLFGRRYPADKTAEYLAEGYISPDFAAAVAGLAYDGIIRSGDFETIAAPLDFLGVNYYNRSVQRSQAIAEADNHPRTVHVAPQSEWTDMGWEVFPEGLYRLLNRLHYDYQPRKIYITENGASYADGPDANGRIADTRRIAFLRDHLAAAHRAIQDGVPLAGYFVWSLMDNFEWQKGYKQRFGLYWVDYATQKRLPKDSALWYRQVIAENGLTL